MSLLSSKLEISPQRGVSLIEMIVVMAIFTIMTIVVMANLPAFRSRTSLDLLAEEVAITVRQAQVFGVGTRVFDEEFPSHGVSFNLDEDQQSFVLFADRDPDGEEGSQLPNGQYDPGEGCGNLNTECREQFLFRGGVGLTKLEGCNDSTCSNPRDLRKLEILFHRPEADAFFNPDGFSYVKLTVSSVRNPAEGNREVRVWNTGHIYACNPHLDSCS